MHLVSQAGEHSANFPIFALVEHHLQNRALFVLGADRDPLGVHLTLGKSHAPVDLVEQLCRRHTRHLHQILLLDAIARMGQKIGQVAVVGDQDQPFAHPIKAADGEQPSFRRHEIHHSRSARGVIIGGHHTDRLVEHVDHPLRVREPLAVNANLLGGWIDPHSEFGHNGPIHLDSASGNQLLTGPAAAEPRSSQ